ncbi:hypothetical protein FDUTEX481_00862 [Tolypothrix sp. PCC 7601]|nr:hypothetical protein FDUTEX481_00862 [Tolypothrix sp. PCC 7601]
MVAWKISDFKGMQEYSLTRFKSYLIFGHGAWGMGHWALGMGHWALGMSNE